MFSPAPRGFPSGSRMHGRSAIPRHGRPLHQLQVRVLHDPERHDSRSGRDRRQVHARKHVSGRLPPRDAVHVVRGRVCSHAHESEPFRRGAEKVSRR